MSYTTFALSSLTITTAKSNSASLATASVKVRNTGSVAGAEILQLYVTAPNSPTQRPVKELHGFEKVFLQPGEEKEVSIEVDRYATSFWDESEGKWCSEEGEYGIWVSNTSEIGSKWGLDGKLTVGATRWWLGL